MKQQKKYSDDEEKQIAQKYIDGYSASELCKMYGFKTEKSITDKVKKHFGKEYVRKGIQNPPYIKKPYAYYSLKTINSKFDAYYLGILTADGCIHDDGSIELGMTDEDVIAFISTNLCKEYKSYNRIGNRQKIHKIVFNNKLLCEDLKRYNVVPRKSYILKGFEFKTEEEKYIPYFIRGCIDGDGWIRKDGKEFFICTASYEYAEWLKYILENKLYMENINIIKADKVYQVRTALEKNINILKYIVYDYSYGMKRKYKLLHDQPSETIIAQLDEQQAS